MNNKDLALAMVTTNYCRQFALAHGRNYDLSQVACGVSMNHCPFKKEGKKCNQIRPEDWLKAFEDKTEWK